VRSICVSVPHQVAEASPTVAAEHSVLLEKVELKQQMDAEAEALRQRVAQLEEAARMDAQVKEKKKKTAAFFNDPLLIQLHVINLARQARD
jgi:hypothetical protein